MNEQIMSIQLTQKYPNVVTKQKKRSKQRKHLYTVPNFRQQILFNIFPSSLKLFELLFL